MNKRSKAPKEKEREKKMDKLYLAIGNIEKRLTAKAPSEDLLAALEKSQDGVYPIRVLQTTGGGYVAETVGITTVLTALAQIGVRCVPILVVGDAPSTLKSRPFLQPYAPEDGELGGN